MSYVAQSPAFGSDLVDAMLAVVHGCFIEEQDLAEGSCHQPEPPVVHEDVVREGGSEFTQRLVDHHRAAGDHVLHQEAVERIPARVQVLVVVEGGIQQVHLLIHHSEIGVYKQRGI